MVSNVSHIVANKKSIGMYARVSQTRNHVFKISYEQKGTGIVLNGKFAVFKQIEFWKATIKKPSLRDLKPSDRERIRPHKCLFTELEFKDYLGVLVLAIETANKDIETAKLYGESYGPTMVPKKRKTSNVAETISSNMVGLHSFGVYSNSKIASKAKSSQKQKEMCLEFLKKKTWKENARKSFLHVKPYGTRRLLLICRIADIRKTK